MTDEQQEEVRRTISALFHLIAPSSVSFHRVEELTEVAMKAIRDALREPEQAAAETIDSLPY